MCDICNREYKYKKNTKRQLTEKHSPTYEYWNCTEDGCKYRFIRKGYVFNHLHKVHHLTEDSARIKDIDTKRGDISQIQEQEYEDISDDDTVLDLIQDLGDLIDTGERFDVDNFLSSADNDGSDDQEKQNNLITTGENSNVDNVPSMAETDSSDQEITSSPMDVSSGTEDTVDENNNIDESISDVEENHESSRGVKG